MKTTVVPAQITTVEDKVAGNLGVVQLFLLTLPIFIDGALFGTVPPLMKVTVFKVVIGTFITLLSATMAIRIKGKILLSWLVTLVRFNMRPRHYIFNKNDTYLREPALMTKKSALDQKTVTKMQKKHVQMPRISIPEMVRLETALADTRSNFRLETNKRGGLDVRITEIK